MSFTITTEHTYWWPVTVRMPDAEKAGQWSAFGFNARFRAMSRSEGKAFLARLEAGDGGDGAEIETIRTVLTGWDDAVVVGDGAPVPFSPTALDTALELHWFRRGVLAAYRASLEDGGPAAGN